MPSSITDYTALTVFDALHCLTLHTGRWGVEVRPAPFGIVSLSNARCAVPVLGCNWIMEGGSGNGWTNLGVQVINQLAITNTFLAGASVRYDYSGASGFPATSEASAHVQATVEMEKEWTFACRVNALLFASTLSRPPPRELRFALGWNGPCSVSADVAIAANTSASVLLATAYDFTDEVSSRIMLRTEPLSTEIAVQLRTTDLPAVTVSLSNILHVGISASLAMEW